MSSSVKVKDVSKTFVLAEKGAGPTPLWHALTAGKQATAYRHVDALSGVTFEAREGERIGVIGRNGAGKTTLLSILAGVVEPSSGLVDIQGDIHAMLTIGAVLRDEATGRENIFLDGAVHGRTHEEISSHADEIIAFADIGEFIDRPVRTYSSGMKARLAFSMGAFIKPDILIIDETLAVGDAFFAQKAMTRIKEIALSGRIVFIVSHSLASIVDMCDRCLWLDQGKLVMDGNPEEVTKAYQNNVAQADEAELISKFEAGDAVAPRPDAGQIRTIRLTQNNVERAATVQAFVPLAVEVTGLIGATSGAVDLEFTITRVDGRQIWRATYAAAAGLPLPANGAFSLSFAFDPLLLGADLYGLDIRLFDQTGPIDQQRRAFEIIDEEGQFGGKPLLYHAPLIQVRPIAETQS